MSNNINLNEYKFPEYMEENNESIKIHNDLFLKNENEENYIVESFYKALYNYIEAKGLQNLTWFGFHQNLIDTSFTKIYVLLISNRSDKVYVSNFENYLIENYKSLNSCFCIDDYKFTKMHTYSDDLIKYLFKTNYFGVLGNMLLNKKLFPKIYSLIEQDPKKAYILTYFSYSELAQLLNLGFKNKVILEYLFDIPKNKYSKFDLLTNSAYDNLLELIDEHCPKEENLIGLKNHINRTNYIDKEEVEVQEKNSFKIISNYSAFNRYKFPEYMEKLDTRIKNHNDLFLQTSFISPTDTLLTKEYEKINALYLADKHKIKAFVVISFLKNLINHILLKGLENVSLFWFGDDSIPMFLGAGKCDGQSEIIEYQLDLTKKLHQIYENNKDNEKFIRNFENYCIQCKDDNIPNLKKESFKINTEKFVRMDEYNSRLVENFFRKGYHGVLKKMILSGKYFEILNGQVCEIYNKNHILLTFDVEELKSLLEMGYDKISVIQSIMCLFNEENSDKYEIGRALLKMSMKARELLFDMLAKYKWQLKESKSLYGASRYNNRKADLIRYFINPKIMGIQNYKFPSFLENDNEKIKIHNRLFFTSCQPEDDFLSEEYKIVYSGDISNDEKHEQFIIISYFKTLHNYMETTGVENMQWFDHPNYKLSYAFGVKFSLSSEINNKIAINLLGSVKDLYKKYENNEKFIYNFESFFMKNCANCVDMRPEIFGFDTAKFTQMDLYNQTIVHNLFELNYNGVLKKMILSGKYFHLLDKHISKITKFDNIMLTFNVEELKTLIGLGYDKVSVLQRIIDLISKSPNPAEILESFAKMPKESKQLLLKMLKDNEQVMCYDKSILFSSDFNVSRFLSIRAFVADNLLDAIKCLNSRDDILFKRLENNTSEDLSECLNVALKRMGVYSENIKFFTAILNKIPGTGNWLDVALENLKDNKKNTMDFLSLLMDKKKKF